MSYVTVCLAHICQAPCLQSEEIFVILNHPCSFMVHYYLFGLYLS